MPDPDARIALLIDADNAPAAKIDLILSELAKYGLVNIRRAYGNWKSAGLQSWEAVLHEYAIRPIQQFDYTKGKNATDMALVIEAMDLLYTQKLDAFGIVSSDCDFTPLVMRILTSGHRVYGFGEKKTPVPFVSACSKFTYLEALGNPGEDAKGPHATIVDGTALRSAGSNGSFPDGNTAIKKTTNELKGDARLVHLLRNAVDATAGDDGWAALAVVGHHISNQASFDSRNYGYSKLSDLFVASGLFDIDRRNGHLYVRDSRSKKTVPKEMEPSLAQNIVSNTFPLGLPLRSRYIPLLGKKNWKTAPRDNVLAFYSALRKVAPAGSKEIVSACFEKLSDTMTLAETEAAFDIFWKAKLFEITSPPDAQAGLKKILTFQDSPHVFRKIDAALLSRLLTACRETATPIDVQEIRPLLYGAYDPGALADMIRTMAEELASKE